MKDLKYIIIAVACIFLASCMGEDYAGVEFPDGTAAPYGNNALKETNVLSIAQLKENSLLLSLAVLIQKWLKISKSKVL